MNVEVQLWLNVNPAFTCFDLRASTWRCVCYVCLNLSSRCDTLQTKFEVFNKEKIKSLKFLDTSLC